MTVTHRVLVINPGSTSTKLALYSEQGREVEENIPSTPLDGGAPVLTELPQRLEVTLDFLRRHGEPVLHGVVGRGGLFRPVPAGTIRVDGAMLQDAREAPMGDHPSNLGCLIAAEVAERRQIAAFVVDPVSVDEMCPLARYSGIPEIPRVPLSHVLNLHAAARKACEALAQPIGESRLVVAHLGGGFSIVPMEGGHLLDTNNANNGGPFSPTRAGTVPTQALIRMCYSDGRTLADMKRLTTREGGLKAYLGTADGREVEARIAAGDHRAREVYEAMAYQIAKEIGAMATVLLGRLHAVVLTGGLAWSEMLCGLVTTRVEFLAPVLRFPGEFEMEALAAGALRVLRGEEQAQEYPGGNR